MKNETNNIHSLIFEEKEIILLGTAHVSKESAQLVSDVIEKEKPDTVCVELCDARYQSIRQKDKWLDTDIIKVIKEKQPEAKILVLTSFSDDDKVFPAIKAGALGYLLKNSSPQRSPSAVCEAALTLRIVSAVLGVAPVRRISIRRTPANTSSLGGQYLLSTKSSMSGALSLPCAPHRTLRRNPASGIELPMSMPI